MSDGPVGHGCAGPDPAEGPEAASIVGNAIGGAVFVALLKYSHVVRGGEPTEQRAG